MAWKTRHTWLQHLRHDAGQTVDFYLDHAIREDVASYVFRLKFRVRTAWLLSLFSASTLLFFSLSTNQEYYTFPVWPPLFILIAGMVAGIEENRARTAPGQAAARCSPPHGSPVRRRSLRSSACCRPPHSPGACGTRATCPMSPTSAPCWPIAPSATTRSPCRTSSTSPAPRLPRCACPPRWPPSPAGRPRRRLGAAPQEESPRRNHQHLPHPAVFLIAAHIAFARFAPMLSSKQMADTIIAKGSPNDTFIIYGDESDGSSVIFYTHNFLQESRR